MMQAYENDAAVYTRAANALRNQQTFDRDQMAWIVSEVQRWAQEVAYEQGYAAGYEQGRRDELALASIATQYADRGQFDGHMTAVAARKVAYRAECDRAARLPRPGDFQGRVGRAIELKVAA